MHNINSPGFQRLISIGGHKLLFQVIDIFLNQVPPRLKACQQHLQNNEFKELHLLAHSIKSSAANLGMDELYKQMAKLEQFAEQKAETDCQVVLAEILEIFPDVLGILKEKHKALEEECQ